MVKQQSQFKHKGITVITTIILSSHQPFKLDLLLRSIDIFWPTHPMLYCIVDFNSTVNEGKSYHLIEERRLMECVTISYRPPSIKDEVLSIIDATQFDYVMFLEDTEVFIKPFNHDCCDILQHKEVLTFSNRIGRDHELCPCNSPIKIPPYHLYDWNNCMDSEYSKQAYSMNGNIYGALDVRRWLNETDEDDVELALVRGRSDRPYIACGSKSCIVSHYDRFDSEQNKLFQQNKQVDISPFLFFDTQKYDVTYEIPLTLEWRS